jgi:hypothetical protein
MQKRFDALPKEGQELLARTAGFFKDIQNDISLQRWSGSVGPSVLGGAAGFCCRRA